MRYFKTHEFDSPDLRGSGINMKIDFLRMLDEARHIAGIPFVINSGYRTREHTERLIKRGLQASRNSSHHTGKAADIAVTAQTRMKIIDACIQAGFRRIGVANSFIHVDNDSEKVNPAAWGYSNTDTKILEAVRKKLGI
jgi:zinc D-Ala-D-Ala carboxypeptidase